MPPSSHLGGDAVGWPMGGLESQQVLEQETGLLVVKQLQDLSGGCVRLSCPCSQVGDDEGVVARLKRLTKLEPFSLSVLQLGRQGDCQAHDVSEGGGKIEISRLVVGVRCPISEIESSDHSPLSHHGCLEGRLKAVNRQHPLVELRSMPLLGGHHLRGRVRLPRLDDGLEYRIELPTQLLVELEVVLAHPVGKGTRGLTCPA